VVHVHLLNHWGAMGWEDGCASFISAWSGGVRIDEVASYGLEGSDFLTLLSRISSAIDQRDCIINCLS
jgi:hypothetical protein